MTPTQKRTSGWSATWRTIGLLLLPLLVACTDTKAKTGSAKEPLSVPAGPHVVVVFATASLKDAVTGLARLYERQHPGAKVELHCHPGAELLQRMSNGEHCDVVAIGDSSLMSRFTAAGLLRTGSPTELARSRLAIAVAAGNPLQIHTLRDLATPGVRLALGKSNASIGRYGRWVLSRQTVPITPALEAVDADAVLAAVAEGTADAGLVYTTSFSNGEDRVARVDIPEDDNSPVLYSISCAREARTAEAATAFWAFAISPAGQQVLKDAGLLPIGTKSP